MNIVRISSRLGILIGIIIVLFIFCADIGLSINEDHTKKQLSDWGLVLLGLNTLSKSFLLALACGIIATVIIFILTFLTIHFFLLFDPETRKSRARKDASVAPLS